MRGVRLSNLHVAMKNAALFRERTGILHKFIKSREYIGYIFFFVEGHTKVQDFYAGLVCYSIWKKLVALTW